MGRKAIAQETLGNNPLATDSLVVLGQWKDGKETALPIRKTDPCLKAHTDIRIPIHTPSFYLPV